LTRGYRTAVQRHTGQAALSKDENTAKRVARKERANTAFAIGQANLSNV
jgi:hypothetical protein